MDKQNTIDTRPSVSELLTDEQKTSSELARDFWKLFRSNPTNCLRELFIFALRYSLRRYYINLNKQPALWYTGEESSEKVFIMLGRERFAVNRNVYSVYEKFKSVVLGTDSSLEKEFDGRIDRHKQRKAADKIIREAISRWSETQSYVGAIVKLIILDRDYIDKGHPTTNSFLVGDALRALTKHDLVKPYVVPHLIELLKDCKDEYEYSVEFAIDYLAESEVIEAFEPLKAIVKDKSHPYSFTADLATGDLAVKFPEHFPGEPFQGARDYRASKEEDRKNGLFECLEIQRNGRCEVLKLTEEEIARKRAKGLTRIDVLT